MAATWLALAMIAPAAVAAPPSPPLFGPVMTAPFAQTITVAGFRFSNWVNFLYDSTTVPVGSSLSQHSQGQHDEVCTAVKGKELSDEPCSLLDSADSWLYVVYPQSKLCCRACNTSSFCGIISPTWLQENATYQGQKVINGTLSSGWMKEGGEQNFYWVSSASNDKKDARVPVQYYEGYPTFAEGSNFWNFSTELYSNAPIPSSTFDVPSGMGCDAMCEFGAESYATRLQRRFEAGVGGGNLERV